LLAYFEQYILPEKRDYVTDRANTAGFCAKIMDKINQPAFYFLFCRQENP
jgi:hypothetical protein